MSVIHFIGGEKGGVGKSVFARLLSQYLIDHDRKFVALDADQSHPTLTRYYADYTEPIHLDVFESADAIMESAIEEDRHVLIDLPAQSQRFLDRWIDEGGVLEISEESDVRLVYWYIVDDGRDSANLLGAFLDKYQSGFHCVVVKNLGRGQAFHDIDALPHFAGDNGPAPRVTTLPALHPQTMRKIDKLTLSFWAAAHLKSDPTGERLGLMERQRARVWLKKANAMIDGVMSGNCLNTPSDSIVRPFSLIR